MPVITEPTWQARVAISTTHASRLQGRRQTQYSTAASATRRGRQLGVLRRDVVRLGHHVARPRGRTATVAVQRSGCRPDTTRSIRSSHTCSNLAGKHGGGSSRRWPAHRVNSTRVCSTIHFGRSGIADGRGSPLSRLRGHRPTRPGPATFANARQSRGPVLDELSQEIHAGEIRSGYAMGWWLSGRCSPTP